MKKVFDVYCDVYGVNLTVIIGMPAEKLRLYLERRYKVDWDYEDKLSAGAALTFNKWPYHVLWLSDKAIGRKDLVPKLSHEVLHHVLRLARDKNIPTYPEIDNLVMDEPIGYLMEFYMRAILTKLGKT